MLLQGRVQLRPFTSSAAAPRLASVLARANKSISTNNVADLPAVPLPESQEEAVKDAALSVVRQVKPNMRAASKAPAKGFAAKAASITSAFHIDIPIASNDADSLVKLAATLVSALSSASFKAASDTLVVFASSDAAAKAAGQQGRLEGVPRGTRFLGLREACRQPQLQAQLLVLIAPTTAEVALAQQLIEETWEGGVLALLVNAEFAQGSASSVPSELQPFVKGITTVWAFQPVQVKGLVGGMQGAVLHRAVDGPLWRILYQVNNSGKHVQIGQTKSRPTSDDLQLAFINASAAQSPLSAAARGVKGLFGGGNKGDKK